MKCKQTGCTLNGVDRGYCYHHGERHLDLDEYQAGESERDAATLRQWLDTISTDQFTALRMFHWSSQPHVGPIFEQLQYLCQLPADELDNLLIKHGFQTVAQSDADNALYLARKAIDDKREASRGNGRW